MEGRRNECNFVLKSDYGLKLFFMVKKIMSIFFATLFCFEMRELATGSNGPGKSSTISLHASLVSDWWVGASCLTKQKKQPEGTRRGS